LLGALWCALVPASWADGLEVEQRADGVFVFSNNPERSRPPLLAAAGTATSRKKWQQPVVAPRELRQRITEHALAQDLDPRLVEALIRVESAFNVRAVSHKGAMGLMQLMPGTAIELGVDDAFDVDDNLRGGTAYLRRLLDRYEGNLKLALAGYNAGPGAVDKYRGVPPYRETTEYVERILAAYGAPAARSAKPVPIRYVSGRRIPGTASHPWVAPPGPSRAVAAPAAAVPLASGALPGAGR
jgi:hypothetical protein